jgi:carbon storage regulator CsrA
MLVLSRKTQERIQIGDNVVVTVLRVKGNMVRIGIEAPKDVRVIRGELPAKTASGPTVEPEITIERPGSSLRKLAEAVLARRHDVPKAPSNEEENFEGAICEIEIGDEALVA